MLGGHAVEVPPALARTFATGKGEGLAPWLAVMQWLSHLGRFRHIGFRVSADSISEDSLVLNVDCEEESELVRWIAAFSMSLMLAEVHSHCYLFIGIPGCFNLWPRGRLITVVLLRQDGCRIDGPLHN